jgi:hypothetical protein
MMQKRNQIPPDDILDWTKFGIDGSKPLRLLDAQKIFVRRIFRSQTALKREFSLSICSIIRTLYGKVVTSRFLIVCDAAFVHTLESAL